MEVRLNKRQKMKLLFGKLGIRSDLTLKSIFKPAISKKVLLHYLDELESKRLPLLDHKAADDKTLFIDLIANNPGLSTKKILQAYGLYKAMELMNMREIRQMLSKRNRINLNLFLGEIKNITLRNSKSSFIVIRKHIMDL